jgi:peptide/nickel transport system permease protein
MIEAGLSYLGLGDPNCPSWGRLIYEGQPYISTAWWISVFPGIFLVATVLGLNFLGDALYRILTPRISNIRT